MANLDEIENLTEYLNAAYPAIPTSAATIAAFADGLTDIPAGELMAAARQHVLENDRFPTIATLRRLALRRLPPQDAFGIVESRRLQRGRGDSPYQLEATV